MRVLVVEDDLLIADYLSMVLEDGGHEVLGVAASAEQAQRLLLDEPRIDIVTLDVRLPGPLNGIGLAAWLRARSGPPFVFITGSGDPEHRRLCEQQHPLAILQKPIRPETLLRALERLH